jgi:hypothetical protein
VASLTDMGATSSDDRAAMEHIQLSCATDRARLAFEWVLTPEGLRMRWTQVESVAAGPSASTPIVALGVIRQEQQPDLAA